MGQLTSNKLESMDIVKSRSQATTAALRNLCGDENNIIPATICGATNTPSGLKKHITPTLIRSRTGAGKDEPEVMQIDCGLMRMVLFHA